MTYQEYTQKIQSFKNPIRILSDDEEKELSAITKAGIKYIEHVDGGYVIERDDLNTFRQNFTGSGLEVEDCRTYDIQYDNDSNSNSEGFHMTYQEAKDYIDMYNGTDEGYFKDYKGGTVSIIDNQSGEAVYYEKVK